MCSQIASDANALQDKKPEVENESVMRKSWPVVESRSTTSKQIDIAASSWPDGFGTTVLLSSFVLGLSLFALNAVLPYFNTLSVLLALALWTAIVWVMSRYLDQHSHATFGAANAVTLSRVVVTVLLASLIPVANQINAAWLLWSIATIAAVTLCMDGLDGYLARKYDYCSNFGARLDMETDALLALVITLFLWRSGTAGIWVLGLGLMRYVFLAASIWNTALRAELFPSLRRKTVCVIQVGALCLMLIPALSALQISVIGLFALVCLLYSFAVDISWLLRLQRTP